MVAARKQWFTLHEWICMNNFFHPSVGWCACCGVSLTVAPQNCMMHEMLTNEILEKRIVAASWRTKTNSFVTFPINIVATISNLRFRLIKTPHGDDGFSLLPDDVLTMKFHARAIIIQAAARYVESATFRRHNVQPFMSWRLKLHLIISPTSMHSVRCLSINRCAFLVEVCRATHFSCWKI